MKRLTQKQRDAERAKDEAELDAWAAQVVDGPLLKATNRDLSFPTHEEQLNAATAYICDLEDELAEAKATVRLYETLLSPLRK